MLYIRMKFLDFLPDGQQVLKGLGSFCHITQQGAGMVGGAHPHIALSHPCAMLAGDAELGIDDLLGGDSAKADDDFRPDQSNLVAQIPHTGLLLNLQRIPVPGRAAFDDVGDIAVGCSVVDILYHHKQQLSSGIVFQISSPVKAF